MAQVLQVEVCFKTPRPQNLVLFVFFVLFRRWFISRGAQPCFHRMIAEDLHLAGPHEALQAKGELSSRFLGSGVQGMCLASDLSLIGFRAGRGSGRADDSAW